MVEVEKLRRKTAYDRHFLLLGVVFSDLVRIRSVRQYSTKVRSQEIGALLGYINAWHV